MTTLSWLPAIADFRAALAGLNTAADPWAAAMALATHRLDFLQTNAFAARLAALFPAPPATLASRPIRLAVLGSATTTHLLGAIRIGGLRHGLWIECFEPAYGQYRQALLDPTSELHRFAPDAVLFAQDATYLTQGLHPGLDGAGADAAIAARLDHLAQAWHLAQQAFRCPVIQQTGLPRLATLMGNNEHHLPGAPAEALARINAALRERAAACGVHLLAIDRRAAQDGIEAWHDPALWWHARQEITPRAAPLYGDMLARLLAALQGRSRKCLVLDLDNTIWGGVIGDDGIGGIVLGQGSALGEGFLAVQAHAKALAARGVILAVCSKNEAQIALEAFEHHPEMLLTRADIACFQANWADKASNLRAIAASLRIGLDALVFLDDNPAERALVRQELPMVAVPEAPDDPALVAGCLADAGYFEAVGITAEDRARASLYQQENARTALAEAASDMAGFLRGLQMRLIARPFEDAAIGRIAQLTNKTNQFNLTTSRLTEAEIRAAMGDPARLTLALRLLDRFGDNGLIAVLIGRLDAAAALHLDTWLMSCRVLGRQVEEASLAVLAEAASRRGVQRLIGRYVPSAKNALVAGLYTRLGFTRISQSQDGGHLAALDLAGFIPPATSIAIEHAPEAALIG